MSTAFTHHGGALGAACARFGGSPAEWLDLSTGINPGAWPSAATAAIEWRALPDPHELSRLESRAAAFFGIDPGLCCAVPGSEMGLRLVARILGLPGLHLPLTYRGHPEAFATARSVPSLADLPPTRTTVVVANPNNPDGRVMPRAALLEALVHQERHGGWLIVDEAFADCREDWSIATEVAEGRRLAVLRSFGKFFGLPGVRLGFVIASAELTESLRGWLGSWPVCTAAATFGARAYADSAWIAATRADLPGQAVRLDAVLRRRGLLPQGACPLFRLLSTRDAPRLFAALAERWILTRPFAQRSDLLRLGLPGNAAALMRLDAALAEAMADG